MENLEKMIIEEENFDGVIEVIDVPYTHKKASIKLADGTKIKDLMVNGTEYVSENKIDESLFTESNLKTVVITVDKVETTLTDVEFIHQQKWEDGWYLAFRELSEQEKKEKMLKQIISIQGQQLAKTKMENIKKDMVINYLGQQVTKVNLAIMKLQKGDNNES